MKAREFDKTVGFQPENTLDAFLLGRLYEKTQEKLNPGMSTGSDRLVVNELIGIRFDAGELVRYLLSQD